MEASRKTLLVWPWSEQLAYHALVDTFVNSCAPDEPRNILPDECTPDPQDPIKLPEPSVEFSKSVSTKSGPLDVSLIFVAATGMDEKHPEKARIDRARVTLRVSNTTVDAVVAIITADEKIDYLMQFHSLIFAKGLEEVPTWILSIDDPDNTTAKAIQARAIQALHNYGSDWHFVNISSKATADEVEALFSGVVSNSGISSPPTTVPFGAKTQGESGKSRRGCTLV